MTRGPCLGRQTREGRGGVSRLSGALRIGSLLALGLGLIGCGYKPTSDNPLMLAQQGSPLSPAVPSDTNSPLLRVLLPGGRSVPFTLHQLRALPQATLEIAGAQASGPTLEEILEAAGVGEFRTVTLVGKSSVNLSSNDISPKVILRLTDHSRLDLAGETIPPSEWVRNVYEIRVR
jgi:hypothetical protein